MALGHQATCLAHLATRLGRLLGRPLTADRVVAEGLLLLAAHLPLARLTGLVATPSGWREVALGPAMEAEAGVLPLATHTHPLGEGPHAIPRELVPLRRVFPLQAGKETYALLDFYPERPLTPDEDQLLGAVGEVLTAALAGLPPGGFGRGADFLYAALQEINQARSVSELLWQVVQFAQASGWERAICSRREPQTLRHLETMMVGFTPEERDAILRNPIAPAIWRRWMDDYLAEAPSGSGWYHLKSSAEPILRAIEKFPSRRFPPPESQWEPNDFVVIPMVGSAGEIIGLLTLDEPPDGQLPSAEGMRPLQLVVQYAARTLEAMVQRELAERRLVAARLLQEMSEVATSALDATTVAQLMLELMVTKLGFAHLAIFLHQGARFQLVAAHGFDDPADRDAPNRGEGRMARAIRTREPQVGPTPDLDGVEGQPGPGEYVLPLLRGTRVEGLVVVRGTPERPLTREDRDLVQALTDQLEQTLRVRHFLYKVERADLLVSAVQETSRHIASILNMDQLLSQIVASLCERLDCYSAHLLTAEGEGWRIRAASGHNADALIAADYRVAPDEGVAGTVGATGLPLLLPDVSQSEQYRPTPLLPDTACELAVPLRLGALSLGVLDLRSREVGAFTADDLATVETIANQLAVALNNAQLFDRLEGQLQERACLYRVSSALLAADTVEAVLAALLDTPHPPQLLQVILMARSAPSEASPDPWRAVASWRASDPLATRLTPKPAWEVALPLPREAPGPFWLRGLETHAALPPELRERWAAEGAQSAVALPLRVGPVEAGGLLLLAATPDGPAEQELRYLEALTEQAAIALERLRLLRESQQRANGLATLTQLARSIVSSLDLSQTLHESVTAMARLLNVKQSSVLLFEPERGRSVLAAQYREDGYRHPEAVYLPLADNPLSQRLMTTRQPVYIRDVAHDPLAISLRQSALPPSYHAMLVLPLLMREEVFGSISLDVASERDFTPEEVALAQAMAHQISVAIVNARQYREATTRAHFMELASEAGHFLRGVHQENQLLEEVLAFFTRHFDLSFAAFYLRDPKQPRRLLLGAATGDTGHRLRQARHVLWQQQGLAGHSLARGVTLVSTASEDERRLPLPIIGLAPAEASFPLVAGGELLGVLNLHSDDPTRFSGPGLAVMETLAAQVTVALQMVRLLAAQRASLRELEKLDALKSEFLATMSHELRTPLNSIIGFSKVMLRELDGPITTAQSEDLTLIHRAGQQLLAIINDILDLTRSSAGKMPLHRTAVAVEALLDEVVRSVRPQAGDRQLHLDLAVERPLPPVWADPQRLRQIMLNLLSNAIRFTEEGGISISAQRVAERRPPRGGVDTLRSPRGSYIQVTVRDTGIGIREEHHETIFEEFRQVDRRAGGPTAGAGLGLAIARRYVEMHGGALWVDSHHGVGSTFRFTLPVARTEEGALDTAPLTALSPPEPSDLPSS